MSDLTNLSNVETLDTLAIEQEARQLRANAFGQTLRAVADWLKSLGTGAGRTA
ncbi:MAG: hypothetical protein AAF646_10505 [Pseudomonadota bacterium]